MFNYHHEVSTRRSCGLHSPTEAAFQVDLGPPMASNISCNKHRSRQHLLACLCPVHLRMRFLVLESLGSTLPETFIQNNISRLCEDALKFQPNIRDIVVRCDLGGCLGGRKRDFSSRPGGHGDSGHANPTWWHQWALVYFAALVELMSSPASSRPCSHATDIGHHRSFSAPPIRQHVALRFKANSSWLGQLMGFARHGRLAPDHAVERKGEIADGIGTAGCTFPQALLDLLRGRN